jgi:hypothetical protein
MSSGDFRLGMAKGLYRKAEAGYLKPDVSASPALRHKDWRHEMVLALDADFW